MQSEKQSAETSSPLRASARPGRSGAALAAAGLLSLFSCGFGLYDGSSAPQAVNANDGVWDSGQWWPWACALPDGTLTNPAAPSTPIDYVASGSCGDGGPLALSVDGCELFADWQVLGLSAVSTTIPSSLPQAGGWEIAATGGFAAGDGGRAWTCDAKASDPAGTLTLTCSAGTPAATACTSVLTGRSGT